MTRFFSLCGAVGAVLMLLVIAGCSSGGSTGGAAIELAASADANKSVVLSGDLAALPAGVAPAALTLTPRLAAEVPAAPPCAAFVAAVECGPNGTTFSQPVTLTFKLPVARTAGEVLPFYLLSGGVWTAIGSGATVSADGLSASATITHFSTYGLFSPTDVVLPADQFFRFDSGVFPGGMPSEIMYNDTDGTLMLPHAVALPVTQAYASITRAPFGNYDDSNGSNPPTFPATAGKVYVMLTQMTAAEAYKVQILSATLRNGATYGAVTFRFEKILPLDIVEATGNWAFANGTIFSVLAGGMKMDYSPLAPGTFLAIDGNYTNANTLTGTWTAPATMTSGPITVTLQLTAAGKLNITMVMASGTITLTDGTKQ